MSKTFELLFVIDYSYFLPEKDLDEMDLDELDELEDEEEERILLQMRMQRMAEMKALQEKSK